jgi:hypothetical protein
MKICRKSGRKRERREHGQPLMDWWKGRYYSVERATLWWWFLPETSSWLPGGDMRRKI